MNRTKVLLYLYIIYKKLFPLQLNISSQLMNSAQTRQNIKNALLGAFPTLQLLKQMVSYKLDTSLEKIANQENLDVAVDDLIEHFESRSSLDELLIAAIRQNPENFDLQGVVQGINNIKCGANYNNSNEFDSLSQRIENIDFHIIENKLYQSLSYLDKNSLEIIENKFQDLRQIKNEKLRISIQLFILKKILTYEYPTSNDRTTVAIFTNNLDSHQGINNSNQPNDEINSYLLIIVKPEQKNKYRINAYMILNEEDKDNVKPLDIELQEKGVLCSFDEIKYQIPQFREQAEKRIRNETPISWKLTIQFFLPIDHLNEKVEQWKNSHNGLDDDMFIGEEHTVIVRSFDRLQDPGYIGKLRRGMDRLKCLRANLNNQIIQESFEHVQELNNLKWKVLKNKLEIDKIGLKLFCPLPSVPDKKDQELLKAIILSGIPIAIWKRSSCIPNINLEDEFNKILNINSLSKSSNLFKLILKERKSAYEKDEYENYFGYDLAVLCEEPNLEEFPDLKAAMASL